MKIVRRKGDGRYPQKPHLWISCVLYSMGTRAQHRAQPTCGRCRSKKLQPEAAAVLQADRGAPACRAGQHPETAQAAPDPANPSEAIPPAVGHFAAAPGEGSPRAKNQTVFGTKASLPFSSTLANLSQPTAPQELVTDMFSCAAWFRKVVPRSQLRRSACPQPPRTAKLEFRFFQIRFDSRSAAWCGCRIRPHTCSCRSNGQPAHLGRL